MMCGRRLRPIQEGHPGGNPRGASPQWHERDPGLGSVALLPWEAGGRRLMPQVNRSYGPRPHRVHFIHAAAVTEAWPGHTASKVGSAGVGL
eukprot:scaffold2487_cov161-Prasinococcus_capsulatus_cf.AAC.3